MAEKDPRISFMVEKPVYQAIQYLATTEGVYVSTIVGNLLKEALQLREDLALAQFAEEREKTFDEALSLSHEEVWD